MAVARPEKGGGGGKWLDIERSEVIGDGTTKWWWRNGEVVGRTKRNVGNERGGKKKGKGI